MRHIITYSSSLVLLLLLSHCSLGPQVDRPLETWVIRTNLDWKPNMIALALNEDLYAAYDGVSGNLYKAWKGDIHFTGIVFDNIHGPQPVSRGEGYILDESEASSWQVLRNGRAEDAEIKFRSYRLIDGQVRLKQQVKLSSGETFYIEETPEFFQKNGKPGLERTFSLAEAPKDVDVRLHTSFVHLLSQDALETNGAWVESSFEEKAYDWGTSITGTGILQLNREGNTILRAPFENLAATEVELEEEEESDQPEAKLVKNEAAPTTEIGRLELEGLEVIGQNDCAACHQANKQVIGPSYTMIARKYESNMETVDMLAGKIINGGSGVWGQQIMSAHPQVSEADAKAMAAYILSVVPDEATQKQPGVAVDFYDIGQPLANLPEVMAGQSPNASEVYPNIDFRSGNPDVGDDTDENFSGFVKDFVMEVNGFLNVPETKTYQLLFIANNGGRLNINGEKVSEGSFYEGTFEEEIEVPLKEGANQIKINFYHHLFGKYLILMWRDNEKEEYEPIPASAFTHNPFDIKPSAPGIKTLVSNKAPGFGASLEDVHPAFDLTAVRPEGFEPRVGDIEFRANGNLVLCTWDGEVYELENSTSTNTEDIKITKIAEGLCEPLGITEVDGEVYVLQRWEVTKLVDHDGDRLTDEYVSIATFGSYAQFHEWSFGLIYKDGYFYCTTGIAMGHRSDRMHIDRGKALKIGMDGSYSYVAHGLKEPNGIGFGPDGEIFVADNEGEWQPVCKILHIPAEGNPFYGNKSVEVDNLPEDLEPELPVIWLPQNEIGNSPSQPILMHHGPYEGQLIHGEITHGGIKRNFIEKVNDQYQGAVFRFAQGLEVGINRLEWGPDGALYAAGLGGAQDFGHQGHQFGLERLTYNGKVPFEMLAIRAKSNGLEVEFTKPLRIGDGTDPSDYKVQQWFYAWLDEDINTMKRNLENIPVKSVSLSEDRTRAFLELEGMKTGHVLYVQLQPTFLSQEGEQLWTNEGWYSLNQFPEEAGIVNPTPNRIANRLSVKEEADGWVSLFDGKTYNGWSTSGNWNTQNGQLVANGETILLTATSFDNYELELEWMLSSGSQGGILYQVPKGEQVIGQSPRFQLMDDQTEEAKTIHTHKSGANYDIQAPKHVVTQPANSYNKARLVVRGNHIEHWVNGIKVTEYDKDSQAWKDGVAASTFATSATYGQANNGRIGLYVGEGTIWFRNIRIRQLEDLVN